MREIRKIDERLQAVIFYRWVNREYLVLILVGNVCVGDSWHALINICIRRLIVLGAFFRSTFLHIYNIVILRHM